MMKRVYFYWMSWVLFACMAAYGQSVTPSTVLDYTLNEINAVTSASEGTGYDYARGMAYFRALQYENALQAFLKALEVDANNPVFLGMTANCHFHLHQYGDAVKWYKKTITASPVFPKAYLRLGLSLERLNRPEEALTAYEDCIQAAPSDYSSLYYAAKILYDQDKLDESFTRLTTLRKQNDEYTEPIYLMAQIARKQGDMEKAKTLMAEFQERRKQEHAAFDELPRLDDDKSARKAAASTHFDLAQVLFESDKPDQAVKQLEKAVAIAPDSAANRLEAVNMAYDRGRAKFAEKQLRWLNQTDKDNPVYAFRLGVMLGLQKRYAEAEPLLQRAVSLAPDNPDVLRALIDCLIQLRRDYPLVLNLALDVVEADPSAISYDLLSRAYYINGRLNDSIEAMGRASQLDSANPVYKKRYQALQSRRSGN